MKKILLILVIFLFGEVSIALDVVYPKKDNVKINSNSTFFIGSANPNQKLTINGEKIEVHPSGGFAHVVNLDIGINKFNIISGDETLIFIINRPAKPKFSTQKDNKFIKYPNKRSILTSADKTPIRTSPKNSGINRMSHFQEGIPLIIDGENNEFYRVVLGDDKKGWIYKANSTITNNTPQSLANLQSYDFEDTKEFYKFIFHLDQKIPYEIIEGDIFYLKLYNIKDCEQNTYTFSFPYSKAEETQKRFGYSGEYQGNDFVWKIRKSPKISKKNPLKDITIAIDAGHGGKDFGAIGCCGDKEKDINLNIAKYLENELKNRNAKVIMTRDKDEYINLNDRVDIANNKNAMCLISIHGNALPDHLNPLEHKGTSIYYYYNQAKLLAVNILKEMTEQLGTNNDKVRQGSLALVRNTNALSILIEVAYLINPEDNAQLIDKKFQKKCAKAIADGIENFLLQNL